MLISLTCYIKEISKELKLLNKGGVDFMKDFMKKQNPRELEGTYISC